MNSCSVLVPRLRSGYCILLIAFFALAGGARAGMRIDLDGNCDMQTTSNMNITDGSQISTTNYTPKGWYKVTLPCTVVGGLLQNNYVTNPYVGENLSKIPSSLFDNSWWYRKTFTLPTSENGKRVFLNFQNISYRANVWLNGKLVADKNTVVGAFREFELDISSKVKYGGATNVLAVETFYPEANDLRMWFSDWFPMDVIGREMGIALPVYIQTSDQMCIRHPLVITKFDLPSIKTAHLTVVAEATNATNKAIYGTMWGIITGPSGTPVINFQQDVVLAPNEKAHRVTFTPAAYPQLNVANPSVWWPWQWGGQPLYNLTLRFTIRSGELDRMNTSFGIRQMTSVLDKYDHRVFSINGRRFLVRGAAWSPDMFLKWDLARQATEMNYVRDLNMNTIRLEGKLMNEDFFNLCDQKGIVVLAGWMSGNGWERWSQWDDEEYQVAYESVRSQMYRLRNHACMLAWLNGSDNHPPAEVEQQYLSIENDLQFPNPILSHASKYYSTVSGDSGVKMNGPYNWEPPVYWDDTDAVGGAWGFNTEVSPGPSPPPLDSLKQFLPSNHLWPVDSWWEYHACGNDFDMGVFSDALNKRYGTARGIDDYAAKAQLAAYESHRAYFEGFGMNKYWATGTIQWMLNNAWPSMYWHLYDWYLRPGGSYFGAKIACELLHIQFSPINHYIVVVNSGYQVYKGLTATADVYDLSAKRLYHQSGPCDVAADGVTDAFTLPIESIKGLPKTYLLRLTLTDSTQKVVSVNSYWLSTVPDVLDFSRNFHWTPTKSFADLTALQNLPPVTVVAKGSLTQTNGLINNPMTVINRSNAIALGVHLRITKGTGGAEVLPILWSDNYFMLLPGETRVITAQYKQADLGSVTPVIAVDTFNDVMNKYR